MTILQIANQTLKRKLVSAIAFPLILMLALAGILFGQVNSLISVTHWVAHTNQVIAKSNYSLKLLVDLETGLRGYLVTDNDIFLEPYQQASSSINTSFKELFNLVSDNSEQQQRIKQLQANHLQWQGYAQKMITLRRNQGDYQNYGMNLEGKQRMDQMRQQVASIVQIEEQLRSRRIRTAQQTARIVTITSTGLTSLIGLILAIFSRRQITSVASSYKRAFYLVQEQTGALQESEERFRLLVEGVKDYAIYMIDPHGYILSWNQGAERIKGYPASEIIGQNFSILYRPEDIAAGKPERELQIAALQGRTEELGMRVRKDGSQFWADVIVTALKDEAGNLRGFAKVTRDITERKQAELEREQLIEQLENERRRLEAVLKQLPVGVIIAEANSGKMILWNEHIERIWGDAFPDATNIAEYAQYHGFHSNGHPYQLDEWPLVRSLRYGEVVRDEEVEFLVNDDSRRTFLFSSTPVRDHRGQIIVGVLTVDDITERKQAEQAIVRYNKRLEVLQEVDRAILAAKSLSELAQNTLVRMRQVVNFRNAFVILFNWEKQQAQVIAVMEDGQLRIETQPQDQQLLADYQSQIRYIKDITLLNECPPFLKQYQDCQVRSCVTVPLVAQENLLGEFSVADCKSDAFDHEQREIIIQIASQLAIAIQQAQLRDQLQRKAVELEQRVKERTTELEEANTELKAFAYSVSHDLRAPLRAMQGFSLALLEDYGEQLDQLGQEYANRIVTASQRLDDLIQDLLDYSRLSGAEIEFVPVDLDVIVSDVIRQIEAEITETQALIEVKQPLPIVIGHRAILMQILTNLITNALKFVQPDRPPQVQIWAEIFEVEGSKEDHEDLISNPQSEIPNQFWVRLWVEDNGIGIDSQYQERIFRVFERLHGIETYPGTGIGLAIVRKGIERLNGRVGVESELGKGSRFWLELPKASK